ncbi:MAG: Asp/Glu racemase [Thermosediminibacteraceae bacterium]|nr:Asp/Glu racemase [Thermosediminibacteraceae bacterium]
MSETYSTFGVIAGTPQDTKMGVDFIRKKGFEAVGVPAASSPEEQNMLQFLKPEILTRKVIAIIGDFQKQNIKNVMIYCNSLSATIDLELIRQECSAANILTPLQAYRNLASRYRKLMVWAANGMCLKTIEKILYENNPAIQIIGISMLPVINAIESLERPEDIVYKFNLTGLVKSFNPEGLVLGCTHLPYLKEKLEGNLSIPVIDPAEEMLKDVAFG